MTLGQEQTKSEIPVPLWPTDDLELASSVFDLIRETCKEYVRQGGELHSNPGDFLSGMDTLQK